jgi:hypothetical protein
MIDPVWALAHGDDPHLLPHHHPAGSIAFYEALGLEKRRELPIRDEAMNYFLGVPGARADLQLRRRLV